MFEAQGVRWKRLRTIASPAFSSSSLRKVECMMHMKAKLLGLYVTISDSPHRREFSTGSNGILRTRSRQESLQYPAVSCSCSDLKRGLNQSFRYYKEFTVDVIHRVAMGQQGPRLFTDKDKVARIEYVSGPFRTTISHAPQRLLADFLELSSVASPNRPCCRVIAPSVEAPAVVPRSWFGSSPGQPHPSSPGQMNRYETQL